MDFDRGRLAWWAGAAVLGGVLAFTVYSFLGTFVLGIFIYYATRPVYRRLERWIPRPTIRAVVALVTLALPAMLVVAYTTAVGLQELERFVDAQNVDLGHVETLLDPYLDVSTIVQDPQAFLNQPSVQEALASTASNALQYVGFLGTLFVHLFAVVIVAFYLLRDDHRLGGWFQRRFTDGSGVAEAYARAVDRDLSTVFFGNIVFAFATGVIAAVSYGTLDALSPAGIAIPYPVLFGLITGIASLVPVVGIKLVWMPLAGWLAFVAFQSGTGYGFVAVFVAVAAVVVDFIPDLLLRPYVSGRDIHLGLVILSYVFGPLLWGWYGLFLGPLALVFVVHFARLVLPELLAGEEISPEALGGDVLTADEGEQTHVSEFESEGEAEES
ncbi:AI-2E family transport protein [Halobacterium hubeiense]|uniref:AI-2E family transport protein n=1 Tax=Halobacterium hubeiense TaxID=1407499 RepID=A0A0U5H381_9EURY|nr:AI-2E family transporter [Halobacterium hubeiense]CQH58005.1 AI-2E family transport protein [Halobacterium hubeiense]